MATKILNLQGAMVKKPSLPVVAGVPVSTGITANRAKASNTVQAAGLADGVGGTVLSNTSHVLPAYAGNYKNFGSLHNPGLTNKQVDYNLTDTNGASGDVWVLYDYNGLSGKTKASTITINVTSNVVLSTTTGAAYTALKSLYGTSGMNPMFNSLRIQGDSSGQLANPINFTYYDENSQIIQTKQVTPSNAFNQGDYQTLQGEFGIQCAITPNFTMWGTINSTGSTTNYLYFTLYMQGYVGERYFQGQI